MNLILYLIRYGKDFSAYSRKKVIKNPKGAFLLLDVVREVITFWKTNKEHIYIPNYRDGLFKITQPTAEEMASFR